MVLPRVSRLQIFDRKPVLQVEVWKLRDRGIYQKGEV